MRLSEVKTLPSRAEGEGPIPDWGATSHMPSGQKNQNIKNRSNVVTNSVKTLKTVHIKNIFKKIK